MERRLKSRLLRNLFSPEIRPKAPLPDAHVTRVELCAAPGRFTLVIHRSPRSCRCGTDAATAAQPPARREPRCDRGSGREVPEVPSGAPANPRLPRTGSLTGHFSSRQPGGLRARDSRAWGHLEAGPLGEGAQEGARWGFVPPLPSRRSDGEGRG